MQMVLARQNPSTIALLLLDESLLNKYTYLYIYYIYIYIYGMALALALTGMPDNQWRGGTSMARS